MKKCALLFAVLFVVGLCAGVANAGPTQLNYRGSLLVFPLMDNINAKTIIEIANTDINGVWLEGYVIAHPPGDDTDFRKESFEIYLTEKEKFWWDTSTAIPARGLQSWDGWKGFIFVWAIDNNLTRLEIDHDFLMGEAIVYAAAPGRAFQYNAIPHQGLAVVGDRVLNLDNVEYTASTRRIYFEGFSAGYLGIQGKLVVALMDIDFIQSYQPEDDINYACWNEEEQYQDAHTHIYQFRQFDIATDIGQTLDTVFTPKWWCQATSTLPLWAIIYQTTGSYLWGTNVWHDETFQFEAWTSVVLPEVQ